MNDTRAKFSKIYSDHTWGGTSRSGPGSDPAAFQEYARLLVNFLRSNNIRSVVDVGCGDWTMGRTIDWSGVDYTGVDIVPDLVDKLNATFGSDHVRFMCLDLVSDTLPDAELFVAKDVLQHLSNNSVEVFLAKLKTQYKAALITNDVSHVARGNWRTRWRTHEIKPNSEIDNGGYRPLRLRDTPFNLTAQRLATIPLEFKRSVLGHPGTVRETKEVLFWKRP